MMHWYITNIRREAPNATVDVFRNYPTRYHSNTCSSTNNRSWGTKKEKTYLDAHSYGMPCCTLAEDDCSQSLSHGQFCNVTSLILRSADISLLKHTQKKTDMPAIVASSNKLKAWQTREGIQKLNPRMVWIEGRYRHSWSRDKAPHWLI